MSQSFKDENKFMALVNLWGRGETTLVQAFGKHLPDDEKTNFADAKDQSSFVSNKIKAALKKSSNDTEWMRTITTGLAELASGANVETDTATIEAALTGSSEDFWKFVASNNQYGETSGAPASTLQTDHSIVSDFELMGCRKTSLRTHLGVLREGVFNVTEEELEEARSQANENGGIEPIVRRCAYLYRLGLENLGGNGAVQLDTYTNKYNFVRKGFGLVIRRVPACFIFSASDPYRLRYEEHYIISRDDFQMLGRTRKSDEVLTAQAYGYAYSDCLALVSRDVVRRNVVRPSLTQLDWKKGENAEDGQAFLPGVITMESDVYQSGLPKPPTAYRVVMKLLGPESKWEDVKNGSYTKRLIDRGDDELFSELDRNSWSVEDCDSGFSRSWSEYFDMLSIRENPLDLLVARELREAAG